MYPYIYVLMYLNKYYFIYLRRGIPDIVRERSKRTTQVPVNIIPSSEEAVQIYEVGYIARLRMNTSFG